MDVNDLPPLWLAYISDPSDSGQCAIIINVNIVFVFQERYTVQ